MLYHLFKYLDELNVAGAGVFKYLTFRAALAIILSLLISMVFGKALIKLLQKKQVGESIRDLGLEGQMEKKGTPTMGGLIILASILIPTLLLCDITNIYIQLMVLTTLWLGVIGFMDDYIKVFKKNKQGLAGKFKIIGQVGIGLIAGSVIYFHPDTAVKRSVDQVQSVEVNAQQEAVKWVETKEPISSIPFVKDNEFNYSDLLTWISEDLTDYAWLVFIPLIIFIVTAVSNGANLTDGLDGLATGSAAIMGATLGVFAYLSGNYIFSDYLNIMYIPHVGELIIYIGAFVGACVGFLWYNSYPASVFMGDTGSLALGGIIAVIAVAVRKELLIPILCGVFVAENLSVMLQVFWFKYTKKKFGEGRRILKMAPLHHHYQKTGMHESKIVSRFWIVGIMLAILSIVTLKLR